MSKHMLSIPNELEPNPQVLKSLVDALYPVLIPLEVQCMQIQAENRKEVEDVARVAWAAFVL